LANVLIKFIDSFPERDDTNKRVFPGVKMSTCIMLSIKSKPSRESYFALNIYSDREFNIKASVIYRNTDIKKIDLKYLTILSIDEKEKKIIIKVSNQSRLETLGRCYEGEINLTFHKKYLSEKQSQDYAPMVKGAAIQKYFIAHTMSQGKIEWVNKKRFLADSGGNKAKHHLKNRLVLQGITGVDEKDRLKFAVLDQGIFCGNSVNYILFNDGETPLTYYLALLNSKLLNWYFKKFSTNSNVNGYEVDSLPIRTHAPYLIFDKVVSFLIFLKEKEQKSNSDTSIYFQSLIDAMVYELYFPDEIKAASCEVLKHLTNLQELQDDWSDERKLATIEQVYKNISHSAHPVSIAMFKMETIEEIRIIEGKQ